MHAYAYAFMHAHTHISTSIAVTSLPVSLWISLQIFPVSGLVPVCCCSATSAPQLHDLSRALPQQHIQRAQALRELTALAAALCGPADSDTTCSRCCSVLLIKRLPILYLLCTISHRPWPICSLSDSFSQSSWHWHCYSWLTPHHRECAPVTLTPSVLRGFTCSWERILIYLFFFSFPAFSAPVDQFRFSQCSGLPWYVVGCKTTLFQPWEGPPLPIAFLFECSPSSFYYSLELCLYLYYYPSL